MDPAYILVIILSVMLLAVVFAYGNILRELKRLKRERLVVEDKARRRARTLVRQAKDRAVEIVGEANIDAVKWQEALESELEKLTEGQVKEYKQNIQTASNEITDGIKSEAEEFKKVLELETIGIEKNVAAKMSENMAAVNTEVQEYREMKFKQIEENIVEIMEEVTRKALDKEMDFNDQAEMVIKALEKAKKQNVLG